MKGKRRSFRASYSTGQINTRTSQSLKTASRLAAKLPGKDQHLSLKTTPLRNQKLSSFDELLTDEELKLVSSACDMSSLISTQESLIHMGSQQDCSRLQASKAWKKSKGSSEEEQLIERNDSYDVDEDDEVISAREHPDIFRDTFEDDARSEPTKITQGYSVLPRNFGGAGEASTNDMKEQAWKYCHEHAASILDQPFGSKYGTTYERNQISNNISHKMAPGRRKLHKILYDSAPEENMVHFSKISQDQIDNSFSAQHFKKYLEQNNMAIPSMMDTKH